MDYIGKHHTPEEMVNILKTRKMIISDEKHAAKKLEHISYYKFKDYANSYANKIEDYENIAFDEVLDSYNFDRELRITLLHMIEKFEISLKTQIARYLGTKDSFSYLQFKNWVNKEKFSKEFVEKKELEFFENINSSIKKNNCWLIKEYYKTFKGDYPPVWIIVEILTLGNVVELCRLMSDNLQKTIAEIYKLDCEMFIQWLDKIKLIRNFSAHNMRIFGLKLTGQKITIKKEWERLGIDFNSILIPLVMLIDLIKVINPNYNFDIINVIEGYLIKYPQNYKKIGFRSETSFSNLIEYIKS